MLQGMKTSRGLPVQRQQGVRAGTLGRPISRGQTSQRAQAGSNGKVGRPKKAAANGKPSNGKATIEKINQSPNSVVNSEMDGKIMEGEGLCDVFVAPSGEVMEVMCCDYGFRSGFGRLYQGEDGEIPKNIFSLGWDNFKKEFHQLRRSFRFNDYAKIAAINPPTNPLEKEQQNNKTYVLDIENSAAEKSHIFHTPIFHKNRLSQHLGSKLVTGLSKLDKRLEEADILNAVKDKAPNQIQDELPSECQEVREALKGLELNNAAVWKMEKIRQQSPDHPDAPWFITGPYLALCWVLDVIYDKRPIERFWFLETVARMPYFAYISMLHLYESLGWWRAGAELRRVHFAEEWNELHHLQIMESLGGDQFWIDRFMAQHAAVFYYWVLIGFFALFPSLAYMFSELVEGHAVDTYVEFTESNKERLKKLPPPLVALKYYKGGDLYYFDYLQTKGGEPRRPSCANLYDVFKNIADDEKEHVKTMTACRDYSIVSDLVNRSDATLKNGKKLTPPKDEASVPVMDTSRLQ